MTGRPRGPICGSELGDHWIDPGTAARARIPDRAPHGSDGIGATDAELLLDLAQVVLDLAGIVDPTPLSDGASMALSLGRSDYSGAAVSAVSMIPYVGDVAKSAKLPRYLATVERAAAAAARNPAFRRLVLPLARQVAGALESVRFVLPKAARLQVDQALSKLERALGGARMLPLRGAPQLERAALQMLELALRRREQGRPIALYFGIGFPPPVPRHYLTLERLLESVPGGKELLAFVDPKAANVSYRDVEHMWLLLSEKLAEAASAQSRVDVFVSPQWFKRMFPGAAVPAAVAEAEFVAGAVHAHSGRYLDEAFNKIESLSLRDVQYIAVTPGGKEVARQRHRL